MPWIEIGASTFDLDDVKLLKRGVRENSNEPSVTVGLRGGWKVELVGAEADTFRRLFMAHVAARRFDVPASQVTEPDTWSSPVGPVEPVGVEDRTPFGIHSAGDHQ